MPIPFEGLHLTSWLTHSGATPFDLRILTAHQASPGTWDMVSASGNYTPTSHACPNPHVFKSVSGIWYLTHSNADETASPSWQNWPTAAKLSIASGTDGINFTPLVDLDYSASYDAVFGNTWFMDRAGVLHNVFPASPRGGGLGDTGNFQMWETHPTSTNESTWGTAATWSTPVEFTGTSLPTSYQDPSIIDDGTNYFMFYGPGLGVAKSSVTGTALPTSGWSPLHAGQAGEWTGATSGGDGPTGILVNGVWYIFYEQTNGNGIHYITTPFNASTDWRFATPTWSGPFEVNTTNTERAGSIIAAGPVGAFTLTTVR